MLQSQQTKTIPALPIIDDKIFFIVFLENKIGFTISLADHQFRNITINSAITVLKDVPSYDQSGINTKFKATFTTAVINVFLKDFDSLLAGINTH